MFKTFVHHFCAHKMPSIHWFEPTKAATRSTQGTANRQRKRVQLSKEARAAIQERRATNRANYDADIKSAEHDLVEKAEGLATTHHKSIYEVERDLRMSSQLTRKHQKKTNTWNAFIWSQAQDKENIGTSTPPINTSSTNFNFNFQTWMLLRAKKSYLRSSPNRRRSTACLRRHNLMIWLTDMKNTNQ